MRESGNSGLTFVSPERIQYLPFDNLAVYDLVVGDHNAVRIANVIIDE